MRVLVAYNGSLNSKAALKQGIAEAKEHKGVLIVLHVFHKEMFIDHEIGYWAEGIARAESARYLEEARRIIREEGEGVYTRIVEIEGHPEEEIVRFARETGIDLIFSPPRYRAISKGIPCPVYIVPQIALNPQASYESLRQEVYER